MSMPLTELHIKYIVDYTLKVVADDPDKWLPQIFCDFKMSAHDTLFGNRMVDSAKNWLATTKINTLLGFDLQEVSLPAVTIHVQGSSPSQSFMNDYSFIGTSPISEYDREVIVPKFQLKSITYNDELQRSYIELKEDMPESQSQRVLPGLHMRDNDGNLFLIGFDEGESKLFLSTISTPLPQINDTAVEVISPFSDRRYRQGAMQFQDNVAITIHGHQHRNETILLHSIIMWGLLKFRPLLIEMFGIDLSYPSFQDLSIDARYMGNAVYARQISLSCRSMYEWEGPQVQDIVGMILMTRPGRAEN